MTLLTAVKQIVNCARIATGANWLNVMNLLAKRGASSHVAISASITTFTKTG